MEKLPLDSIRWPLAALIASILMLAGAHFFERVMLLAACPLCYNQRQAYWVAGGLAIIAIIMTRRGPGSRMLFAFNLLTGVTFLAGAGVAAYHSLVEWKILPAPDTCATGSGVTVPDDILGAISRPMAVPSCADPMWDLLGVTMANFNFLISLALAAATFYAATHTRGTPDTANELPAE